MGIRTDIGAKFTFSALELKPTGLLDILGLSARLIGGGPTLKEESLLSSPDRLGGGGEGGSEDGLEGGFLESNRGVFDRLGILKCPGEELPDGAEKGASVDKYAEAFANERFKFFIFGGD
jgi:hypothetical protein